MLSASYLLEARTMKLTTPSEPASGGEQMLDSRHFHFETSCEASSRAIGPCASPSQHGHGLARCREPAPRKQLAGLNIASTTREEAQITFSTTPHVQGKKHGIILNRRRHETVRIHLLCVYSDIWVMLPLTASTKMPCGCYP